MGEAVPPFGVRDAVVIDRPSRYRGLRVTAVAFASRTPRIRAYLHTPGWGRIVATGTGTSAGDAATRAEDLLDRALSQGVVVGPVP
jgi:fructoselysine-6-P-deglycase FrlB-like protein